MLAAWIQQENRNVGKMETLEKKSLINQIKGTTENITNSLQRAG